MISERPAEAADRAVPGHWDRSIANDQAAVLSRVIEIASQGLSQNDGVEFLTETATSRVIRNQAIYPGVRIAMDCAIATAMVKFRLDVNFGDPIVPGPSRVTIPPLRPGMAPVRVLGYPIAAVLAEKIATAITLGPANTRVRDYADIYTLTGNQAIAHRTARSALLATTSFRGTPVEPLSATVANIVELRRRTYDAYCGSLGPAGLHLPADFQSVVTLATTFADPLAEISADDSVWIPDRRRWEKASNRHRAKSPDWLPD